MNLKKVLPLVVALVLGLAAAKMVVSVIQQKASQQATNGPKLAKVVVAGRDIAAGDQLTEDDVTVGQIAADSAPSGGFSESSALDGRVAAVPLVKGQAVLETLLAPKGSGSGLQAAIPQGMRALTIDVNEISGVAGYITPGSRVDIVQPLRDVTTNQPIERFIVSNVQVTAVGVRGSLTADQNTAHSVTLLVTPRQAATIDLATANGRPRLVLRNTLDKESPDVPTITLAELTGPSIAPPVTQVIPMEVVAPIHPAIDPFAPTTRPAPVVDANWRMRVINAGEPGEIDVKLPKSDNPVTHTDTNDVNNP